MGLGHAIDACQTRPGEEAGCREDGAGDDDGDPWTEGGDHRRSEDRAEREAPMISPSMIPRTRVSTWSGTMRWSSVRATTSISDRPAPVDVGRAGEDAAASVYTGRGYSVLVRN
jgi:hypothetical protein